MHIGQPEIAERVHNAWLRTIEDGIHTYDIYKEGVSREKVGTREFAEAVVSRMGERPQQLNAGSYKAGEPGEAFVGPGGELAITFRNAEDGGYVLVVEDDGPGPAQAVEGLGMRLVQRLAQQLGGAVAIGPRQCGGFSCRVTVPGRLGAA